MKVRLGTRASGLARAHSGFVTDRLAEVASEADTDLDIVVVPVTAEKDSPEGRSPRSGQGVLIAALRVALLSGECDMVVHALEDVPIEGHPELAIQAILKRRDARDALCTDGPLLADLPAGARIAADSSRRTAQVLALRPDLQAVETAGSIDFQFERLSGGEYEGLVLGKADLDAVGRPHSAVQIFEVDDVVPAAGQGTLIVETRANAPEWLRSLLRAFDDKETRSIAIAERSVLEVLDAGTTSPVGVNAVLSGTSLRLHVRVLNRAGTLILNDFSEATPDHARTLGRNAGLTILGRGGARLLKS
ncbi:MAG: hydroxymethylbilane synthase [Demequinaceae bacterium]|nr:hydroxymethylbilane synthase [Demequinaceae bacterium]